MNEITKRTYKSVKRKHTSIEQCNFGIQNAIPLHLTHSSRPTLCLSAIDIFRPLLNSIDLMAPFQIPSQDLNVEALGREVAPLQENITFRHKNLHFVYTFFSKDNLIAVIHLALLQLITHSMIQFPLTLTQAQHLQLTK